MVCLVGTEDEAYTYNRRVSRLATIQEHKMILRKRSRKVFPRAIALRVLDVNISSIRHKKTLIGGLCDEVVDMLKEKHVPLNTIGELEDEVDASARGRPIDDRDEQIHGNVCKVTCGLDARQHAFKSEEKLAD